MDLILYVSLSQQILLATAQPLAPTPPTVRFAQPTALELIALTNLQTAPAAGMAPTAILLSQLTALELGMEPSAIQQIRLTVPEQIALSQLIVLVSGTALHVYHPQLVIQPTALVIRLGETAPRRVNGMSLTTPVLLLL